MHRSDGLQYDNSNTDARFADIAFAFTAPLECCTVPLVTIGYLFLLCTLFYARAVPHCDSDEGGEPEDCVERVHGEEGVCVCEACGAGPHGDHGEVDYGGEGEEAL